MEKMTKILVLLVLQLLLVSCDEVATIQIQTPTHGSTISATATQIEVNGSFVFPKKDQFVSVNLTDGTQVVTANTSSSGNKGTYSVTLPYSYSTNIDTLNLTATLKTNQSTATKKIILKLERRAEAVANFSFMNRQDLGAYVGVLDASPSSSPNGKIVKYVWTIGNQTQTTTVPTLQYTFPGEGTFPISLTITTAFGLTATKNLDAIVIFNKRPVAPSLVNNGKMVSRHTYNLTLPAASDPEGDAIKYRLLETSPIVTTKDCLINNLDCTVTTTADSGDVWIKYMAYDQYGDAINATQVDYNLVPNSPPILLNPPLGLRTFEDLAFTFSVSEGVDQNNDFLTYQLYERPKHGTIRNCLQNDIVLECEYIPAANYNGNDSFSYRAFDGVAYSNPSKVNLYIDFVNDPPVFAAKMTTIDLDNKESSPTEIFLPMATDAEEPSTTLTYKIVTPPAHGQLDGFCFPPAIANGEKCYFIPAVNYDGDDSFVLEAMDEKGAKDTYTVNLKIHLVPTQNYAPELPANQLFRGNENERMTLAFHKGTDRNRDPLTLIFISEPAPVAGDLIGCPNSPTCIFQPKPGFVGNATFSYKVNDGKLDSNVSTVKIIIEKSKPIKIFAGGTNTCALFSNNKFKCWGDNTYGQLRPFGVTASAYGINTDDTIASLQYVDLSGSKDLSIGDGFMCAILYGGYVKCWGRNDVGQLGVGNTKDYSTTPLSQIPYVQDSMGRPFRDMLKIRSASNGTCVILNLGNGQIYCWGKVADHGGLYATFTGLMTSSPASADVPQLEISNNRICVTNKKDRLFHENGTRKLYSTDDAKCIGDKFHPAWIHGEVPKMIVSFPEEPFNIGMHMYFSEYLSMATKYPVGTTSRYLIFPMGRAIYSYLNLPTQSNFYVVGFERYGRPDMFTYSFQERTFFTYELAAKFVQWLEPIIGAAFDPINEKGDLLQFPVYQNPVSENQVIKLTGSETHICALSTNQSNQSGQVKCWGKNDRGQLGIDTGLMTSVGLTDNVINAKAVNIVTNVIDVAAGSTHTCAIASMYNSVTDVNDNDIFCWGDNTRGQFGMLMHNTMSKVPMNVFTNRYKNDLSGEDPSLFD